MLQVNLLEEVVNADIAGIKVELDTLINPTAQSAAKRQLKRWAIIYSTGRH